MEEHIEAALIAHERMPRHVVEPLVREDATTEAAIGELTSESIKAAVDRDLEILRRFGFSA